MKATSRYRLELFAWATFVAVLVMSLVGLPHTLKAFSGSVEDYGVGFVGAMKIAREEARKQPNRDDWTSGTKGVAAIVGPAILQTKDETVWTATVEGAKRNAATVAAPSGRLSSILQWISGVLLLYAVWGLARLATAYRRGEVPDAISARVFRRTAKVLWWRALVTMGVALCAAGIDWQTAEAMWAVGAPSLGIFHLPNSIYALFAEFLPSFSGATAIVVGVMFYAAASVLESREQLGKDLEGTV